MDLENLSESLDTEIKTWLDPRVDDDKAKIARACIALRNHGGGYLVIGFADKTSLPDNYPFEEAVPELYHSDVINGCVWKHAVPNFEVEVSFETLRTQKYPVIKVPSGVRFPVMTRSKFGDVIARQHMVITRIVSSGRVSSAEPQKPGDWDQLIETCFNNREADIGRFFRRHLGEIKKEVEGTDGRSAARRILDEGHVRFLTRLEESAKKTIMSIQKSMVFEKRRFGSMVR